MTKQWWKAAGIRAIRTVAQTAIASIGTSVVLSNVNWLAVASASVLAGILSLLTSVAGLPENDLSKQLSEYHEYDSFLAAHGCFDPVEVEQ
jgi:hypothetical protein